MSFKNQYPTHDILSYNTLKIETNNENGIKMCQMHENLRKSVLSKWLGQGRNPECNNKKM